MSTICLCMIVKNEIDNIQVLLNSVIDHIDSWCIFDTGSTDGTQQLINNFFEENKVDGKLFEVDWINFSENRNMYLECEYTKRFDYILTLDADQQLIIHNKDWKKNIRHVLNTIKVNEGITQYWMPYLISTTIKVSYSAVTHEYLTINQDHVSHFKFNDISVNHFCKPNLVQKSIRDINMIKHELANPTKYIRPVLMFRYYTYLARSYRNIQLLNESIHWYKRSLLLSNEDVPKENVWYNMYLLGIIYMFTNQEDEGIRLLQESFEYYPKRAEPVGCLMTYYHQINDLKKAKEFGDVAINVKFPKDCIVNIDEELYTTRIPEEYKIICSKAKGG